MSPLAQGSEDEPPWIYYHDRTELTGVFGRCYHLLGLTAAARRATEESISLTQVSMVRNQAVYLTELASTYVPEGEIEEACRLGGEAVTIAHETASGRVLKFVQDLRSDLEPWNDLPAVKELDARLAMA